IDLRSDTLCLCRRLQVYMQHLLDFVHEHTLEEQLYMVIEVATGELELLWQRRHHPGSWQLRPHKSDAPHELVQRETLLASLEKRGANMERVETELRAIVMTQIAYASLLLGDARTSFGEELLEAATFSHQEFARELNGAITELVVRP